MKTHLINLILAFTFLIGAVNTALATEPGAADTVMYSIYAEKVDHGIPSGYMGEKNGSSIKVDLKSTDSPYKGQYCLKVTCNGTESWGGVFILQTGTWISSGADKMKLADLRPYDKLVFYARADKKMNVTAVGLGETAEANDKLSDLELDTKWKKFEINIKSLDREKINGLFYFVLNEAGTIYFDEVKYIGISK